MTQALYDPGPMARLEAVKEDTGSPSVIFQRLTDARSPERLKDIALAWGLPRGRFVEWFTTEHAALYDVALKVRAGELVLDALEISDEASSETVKVDGLRVKTRLEIASHWDRGRYGSPTAAVQVNIGEFGARSTAMLVEDLARLLESREDKVVSTQATHPETDPGEI